ncbi:MAG: DUF2452 domain-containing protein [Bacteroidota bacterium]
MSKDYVPKPIEMSDEEWEQQLEKITDSPSNLPYAHHAGSALIKPEDEGKIKGKALMAMEEQTNHQLKQIYGQVETLVQQAKQIKDRITISERIYQAKISFDPVMGKEYFLYETDDGGDVLSLIGPKEWGRSKPFKSFISKVKLQADHTWDVLETNSENEI